MPGHPTDSDSKVIFPDQWHGRAATPGPELPAVPNSVAEKETNKESSGNKLNVLSLIL